MPAEANRGYPVHLRGVVTFVDDFALFVQDSSAGIAVIASNLTHEVRAGQLIELDGITECPRFAPQINKAQARVVGVGQMPFPRRVSFEHLASTEEDSQWAEVEGIVRTVVPDEIPISSGTGCKHCRRGRGERRSVAGAASLDVRRRRGELGGLRESAREGWPAPSTTKETNGWGRACSCLTRRNSKFWNRHPPVPSNIPLEPISGVLRFNLKSSFGHRVHIRGGVTRSW